MEEKIIKTGHLATYILLVVCLSFGLLVLYSAYQLIFSENNTKLIDWILILWVILFVFWSAFLTLQLWNNNYVKFTKNKIIFSLAISKNTKSIFLKFDILELSLCEIKCLSIKRKTKYSYPTISFKMKKGRFYTINNKSFTKKTLCQMAEILKSKNIEIQTE